MQKQRISKKERSHDDEVKIMEERLNLLKQQMLIEKQRRQDLLQKNGGNGIWKTGGVGPIRDKKAVGEMVRLETLRRESSLALDSETSRASTARKMSPTNMGLEDEKSFREQAPSTPPRTSLYSTDEIHASERSVQSPSSSSFSHISGQPNRPMSSSASITCAEIQTETPSCKRWEIAAPAGNKRPQSAPRVQTYFDKIREARRQVQVKAA